MLAAVYANPVTEGAFVDTELLRDPGDRARGLDHHLHGFVLEFRREALLRSGQLLHLSRLSILMDGLSGRLGAPHQPGETIYRVQMSKPIPIHFSTMIGDVLHNLRSALDCAAWEMARRTVGRDLTEQEEHACEFPIRSKPSELRKFFKHCLRT